MRVWALVLVAVGLLCGGAVAQSVAASKPVLVELFTSEGCSSCPPADALLQKLKGMRTEEGQTIVVLSEHVTYWNHDGWVDPFSDEVFTERQNAYGERFKLESVYTPQVVVGGDRQVLGSDGGAILKAVRAESGEGSVALRIDSVLVEGGKVAVTYSVSGDVAAKGAELFAVVADDVASSQVARGENAGRVLTHVSVARSLTRVGKMQVGTARARIPWKTPKEAGTNGGQHLVLFAQVGGQGKVLGVASERLGEAPAGGKGAVGAVVKVQASR
jgi:hypothetical protein